MTAPLVALTRSETTKLLTSRPTWILAAVAILGTWPMAWSNAVSGADLPADDPRLFSSQPIPVDYQGFEMAGFGYVLIVALAALWAGSEYGSGKQLRTTLLATPQRLRILLVKAGLLALITAAIAVLTMTGAIVITHAAGTTGVNPWALTPTIWQNLVGLTLAWTLTSLITFAIGMIAKTAIVPLILMIPLVIGVGDFLAGFWVGAGFLPIAAGAALYSDPASSAYLDPAVGGLVQLAWTAGLLTVAAFIFTRRDA